MPDVGFTLSRPTSTHSFLFFQVFMFARQKGQATLSSLKMIIHPPLLPFSLISFGLIISLWQNHPPPSICLVDNLNTILSDFHVGERLVFRFWGFQSPRRLEWAKRKPNPCLRSLPFWTQLVFTVWHMLVNSHVVLTQSTPDHNWLKKSGHIIAKSMGNSGTTALKI